MRDEGSTILQPRAIIVALWCGVLFLATIGIVVTVTRGLLLSRLLYAQNETTYIERIELELTKAVGVDAREVNLFEKKFVDYPLITAIHIIAGFLFMILAPVQFSSKIRSRNLQFHRRSGRLLVVMGALFGISGILFGLITPFGGKTEASATTVFGVFLLLGLSKAVVQIRKRDLIGHRKWMIRVFAVAFGVPLIRVVLPIIMAFTHSSVQPVFGISVWVGWIISVGVAEIWIRYTHSVPAATAKNVSVT